MLLKKRFLIFLAGFFISHAAYAGTKVLGYEIGVSTLGQVRPALEKQTKVTEAGINKYAGGLVLRTDGKGYGMEGLHKAEFFFDDKKKLAAVFLYLAPELYVDYHQALAKQYRMVANFHKSEAIHKYARFIAKDAVIDIEYNDPKWNMFLRYLRKDVMRKYLSRPIPISKNPKYPRKFITIYLDHQK